MNTLAVVHLNLKGSIAVPAVFIALLFFALVAWAAGKYRRWGLWTFGIWMTLVVIIAIILMFTGTFGPIR